MFGLPSLSFFKNQTTAVCKKEIIARLNTPELTSFEIISIIVDNIEILAKEQNPFSWIAPALPHSLQFAILKMMLADPVMDWGRLSDPLQLEHKMVIHLKELLANDIIKKRLGTSRIEELNNIADLCISNLGTYSYFHAALTSYKTRHFANSSFTNYQEQLSIPTRDGIEVNYYIRILSMTRAGRKILQNLQSETADGKMKFCFKLKNNQILFDLIESQFSKNRKQKLLSFSFDYKQNIVEVVVPNNLVKYVNSTMQFYALDRLNYFLAYVINEIIIYLNLNCRSKSDEKIQQQLFLVAPHLLGMGAEILDYPVIKFQGTDDVKIANFIQLDNEIFAINKIQIYDNDMGIAEIYNPSYHDSNMGSFMKPLSISVDSLKKMGATFMLIE